MKVLVVDDEAPARERLCALLARIAGLEVVGQAANGRDAVEACQRLGADLVLMDIRMPVMNGLEAAHHLAELEPPPAVIFCTAYDQHALAAWEAHALDFLVKPVRAERLRTAIERASRFGPSQRQRLPALPEASPQRSHICARVRGNLVLVPVDQVLYLNAEDKYVVVHHRGGEVLVEESLRHFEQEFGERFIRIHRNCLVAAEQVAALRRDAEGHACVELRDAPVRLDVSRRCLPAVRRQLRQL